MNILHLVPPAELKHVAGSSGGEWAGPCPWCGGRDRFRVWPDHPSGDAGGRYLCRGCGRHGDAIQFLRDRDGLNYVEACAALRVEPRTDRTTGGHVPPVRRAWEPRPATTPVASWQEQAARFVAECAANMTPGSEGMAYAEGRGLTPDTLARLSIGWNPQDRFEGREAWGLEPELNDKGNPRRVWLPAGLVIPSRRKSGLVALKVRRASWTPDDTLPKYVAVAGSVPGLALGGGPGKSLVVVESELDAVLIWQEARDLTGALALGTATGKPDADVTAYLRATPRILVALDFDRAGIEAWPWWKEHFPKAEPWPCPAGKDVGEMGGTPGLVRAWIEAATLTPADVAVGEALDELVALWRREYPEDAAAFDAEQGRAAA